MQLNFYSGVNAEVSDLLDIFRRADQSDYSLMDSHLKPVVSICAVSAWTFPDCESKSLGGMADRAVGLELLVLSTIHEASSDYIALLPFSKALSSVEDRVKRIFCGFCSPSNSLPFDLV